MRSIAPLTFTDPISIPFLPTWTASAAPKRRIAIPRSPSAQAWGCLAVAGDGEAERETEGYVPRAPRLCLAFPRFAACPIMPAGFPGFVGVALFGKEVATFPAFLWPAAPPGVKITDSS